MANVVLFAYEKENDDGQAEQKDVVIGDCYSKCDILFFFSLKCYMHYFGLSI